uniref:Uncharacterized protein n=1 Tax=Roseihalotalea indica TaxID=2867963 RepID=A0AA49JIK7_9BACT|nr:hypothetical protein K4G66_24710 [Tunicatimonas sp. TK19036]
MKSHSNNYFVLARLISVVFFWAGLIIDEVPSKVPSGAVQPVQESVANHARSQPLSAQVSSDYEIIRSVSPATDKKQMPVAASAWNNVWTWFQQMLLKQMCQGGRWVSSTVPVYILLCCYRN